MDEATNVQIYCWIEIWQNRVSTGQSKKVAGYTGAREVELFALTLLLSRRQKPPMIRQ